MSERVQLPETNINTADLVVAQHEMPFAFIAGKAVTQLPHDLYLHQIHCPVTTSPQMDDGCLVEPCDQHDLQMQISTSCRYRLMK